MRIPQTITWIVSGALAFSAGCTSNHVAVDAKSESLATYQARQGGLNTPGFVLGDVIAVDKSGNTFKVTNVAIDPTEIAITPGSANSSEPFASPFDLSYSQQVSPAVQASVDDKVRGESTLHVENCFTRSIKKPAVFTAGSNELAKAVQKAAAQHPDASFFLVTAVTSADKVFISFDDAQGSTAKIDKYQFHISYSQNHELEKLAKESTAFFRVAPLKIEDEDGRVAVMVDKDAAEKLPVASTN